MQRSGIRVTGQPVSPWCAALHRGCCAAVTPAKKRHPAAHPASPRRKPGSSPSPLWIPAFAGITVASVAWMRRGGIRGDEAAGFPVVCWAACGLPRCVIAGRLRFPSRSEAALQQGSTLSPAPLPRAGDAVRGAAAGIDCRSPACRAMRPCMAPLRVAGPSRSKAALPQCAGATRRSPIAPDAAFMRRWPLGRRPAAVPLCGAAQVLLCGCLFAQLAETAMSERLLDALAQFVRFAKQAAGSRLFRSFTFVVHVVVRCQHK